MGVCTIGYYLRKESIMRRYTTLPVPVIILTLACTMALALSVGSKAPDFQLRSVDGKSIIKLSDYSDKPTLLVFWATWCPHCRTELPVIQKVYSDLHGKGLQAIGINLDRTTKDARQFMSKNSITFPVAFAGTDKGSKVADSYDVSGIPATFVIDKTGKIKAVFRGDVTEKTIRDELKKLGL